MRLTAVDIEARRFRRAMRGYSIREVEDFRQEAVDNFEELLIENSRQREQVDRLETEVKHYRAIEQNMNASLILAQRAADNVRAAAHQEAEAIVRDAKAEALAMLREARQQRAAIERATAELAQQRDEFVAQFLAFLQAHIRKLESYLSPDDRADFVSSIACPELPAVAPTSSDPAPDSAPALSSESGAAQSADTGAATPPSEDAVAGDGEAVQQPAGAPPNWLMAVSQA